MGRRLKAHFASGHDKSEGFSFSDSVQESESCTFAFKIHSGTVTAPAATPLPKLQLTTAVLVQAGESLSAIVIFPIVPQFVRNTGITGGDERKTGYCAGVLESIFFIAEFLSVYAWSLRSNTFRRRPILSGSHAR
ncbi:hypothetical protein C8F01DRAFT_1244004 [Mycena amicta]|nr:hypothetical protein C8F01DRAFT_1244004 [Mycena amicta]